jgi:thioredoxin 2
MPDSQVGEFQHIVCPHCGAINRVPGDRQATAASCGTCKMKLFAAKPLEVNAASFERHTAKNDIPVLVDVWAPWCGPCRAMAPQFERAADMLEPEVRLLKLNADEEQAISARYGVRSIPTMLLFKDGKLKAQTAGAMDAGRIVAWAKANL